MLPKSDSSNSRIEANELRLGVVGLGLAGGMMLPFVDRHPRAMIAGAAEPNETLRRRFSEELGLPGFDDMEALVERDDIDAVYIATPHQLHKSQTILAARHGKHVLVEKPMALTLDDCDAMIAACEANGVQLLIGHTHGFDPAVLSLRECVTSQRLGKLAMLSMWNYTNFLYRPRRPEELDTLLGGGILFNQIPHQIEMVTTIANSRIRAVRASTAVLDPIRPTEGSCSAFLELESGACATLVYSGYDRFDTDELYSWISSTGVKKEAAQGSARLALYSSGDSGDEHRRRIEEYGFKGLGSMVEPTHQPHFGLVVASFSHGDVRTVPDGLREYTGVGSRDIYLSPDYVGRDAVLDELCAAVLDRRPPVHDGKSARHTLEVCLAIQRSAVERREVVLSI